MSSQAVGSPPSRGERSVGTLDDPRLRRALLFAVVIVALVPPYRMLGQVIGGSALQFGDYWLMLPRFASPDGGLILSGLFEFQSQPVVIPQFVYFLNVKLFSGSNTSLGIYVMALALGQLAIVGVVLRRSSLAGPAQAALFLLASALIFDLNGTWSFAKAMSGTAWLGANFFALLAVHLRATDRRSWSLVAAVAAAASYGTGLAVWPAVAVAGATRLPVRQWWREWPSLVGFAGTFAWYRSQLPRGEGEGAAPFDLAELAASLLHLPFGLEVGSLIVGYLLIAAIVVLVPLLALTTRPTSPGAASVAAWVGLATYGLVAVFTIGYGRDLLIRVLGIHPRYTSLSALAWLGGVGLAVFAWARAKEWLAEHRPGPWVPVVGSPWLPVVAITPIIALAMLAGDEHLRQLEVERADQDLREVAARIGVIDDTTYLIGGPFSDGPITITPLLSSIGHHPFVDSWGMDCGLIDAPLPDGSGPRAAEVGEVTESRSVFILRGAVEVSGHIDGDRDVDCIVVVGGSGTVVGAATVGVDGADDGSTGFRALARPGEAPYRVWAFFEGDPVPVPVGEPVQSEDLTVG